MCLMGQLQLLYMLSYNFLCVHCFLRLDNPMDEHRQYVFRLELNELDIIPAV